MTVLDLVQIGFLIIVVVIGVGGIFYVINNEEENKNQFFWSLIEQSKEKRPTHQGDRLCLQC